MAQRVKKRGTSVWSSVRWGRRRSEIRDAKGQIVFEMDGIEAPESFSGLAVDIAASKYFHRSSGERSIRQMIDRVVQAIVAHGRGAGYFRKRGEAEQFCDDLILLLLQQKASFNSPVWFNCGVSKAYGASSGSGLWHYDRVRDQLRFEPDGYKHPQNSACFILSVRDSLDGIFDALKTEAQIFKFGSGAGANFSTLRGKGEPLRGGGKSSGLIAFLEVFDRAAGAVKSGGTTRRAAKMVIVDDDHPEVLDFIDWKAKEEKKVRALAAAGYSLGIEGEAYHTVSGQNANHSLRLSDRFMRTLEAGGMWALKSRVSGKKVASVPARLIWDRLCEAAWDSADPGVHFADTIQKWHTCAASGSIRSSNPCSEYMFLDDTACNLASLNLVAFLNQDGEFAFEEFFAAVRLVFIAQEILLDMAGYPTATVALNSAKFRTLGLGYANLGGLLMRMGLPYDSDESRAWAAMITSGMSAVANATSIEMAKSLGAFSEFKRNRVSMLRVMKMHLKSHQQWKKKVASLSPLNEIWQPTERLWRHVVNEGARYGFRNAQSTVLAPTGTIGLFMDCDTTGIEPEFALKKVKDFVGASSRQLVNHSVAVGLKRLGYGPQQVTELMKYLNDRGHFVGCPLLKPEHLAVFDCAQEAGGRAISPAGHLEMMAAVQPFLSGAISKTVNLPASATVEDVKQIYLQAWRLQLKAVAIYRESAKASQVLRVAPTCSQCGHLTVRSGNCFKCLNCGHSESCG